MPTTAQTVMEPRKSPVQARSAASVDAILEATLQVLVQVGKERLTTTRVAHRAGVSVGTLYQYFPNKASLLRATLQHHMDQVAAAMQRVCLEQRGQPIEPMMTSLMTAFLQAKMTNPKASAALYAVSSDIDGATITRQTGLAVQGNLIDLLKTLPTPLTTDVALAASMIQGVMNGVSRRLLEAPDPAKHLESLRQELILMACTYLRASSASSAPSHTIDP